MNSTDYFDNDQILNFKCKNRIRNVKIFSVRFGIYADTTLHEFDLSEFRQHMYIINIHMHVCNIRKRIYSRCLNRKTSLAQVVSNEF